MEHDVDGGKQARFLVFRNARIVGDGGRKALASRSLAAACEKLSWSLGIACQESTNDLVSSMVTASFEIAGSAFEASADRAFKSQF